MNKYPILALLSISLMLSACGFHLRGQGSNLTETNILLLTQNPDANFERSLKQRLKSQGGVLIDSAVNADLHLAIVTYQQQRRVVARDSQGRPSEIELILELNYLLTNRLQFQAEIEPVIQRINTSRNYSYNRNISSGQDNEELRLTADMENDLITRLLLQMAKVK